MKLRLYKDGLMVVMTTHQWLMISLTFTILFPIMLFVLQSMTGFKTVKIWCILWQFLTVKIWWNINKLDYILWRFLTAIIFFLLTIPVVRIFLSQSIFDIRNFDGYLNGQKCHLWRVLTARTCRWFYLWSWGYTMMAWWW